MIGKTRFLWWLRVVAGMAISVPQGIGDVLEGFCEV
jgi:hypothetical protein